jgi:bifunctional non-homologous end joining protein LigD
LAEARPRAFTSPGWLFELKLDGFRLLAERIGGRARLILRRGREASLQFPEIVQELGAVPGPDFILDGELVIQDAEGHPIFQRLLKRSTLTAARDIDAAMRADPAVYFAFDLLMYAGDDLRELPLAERKRRLFEVLPKLGRVLPVEHVEENGEALLELVKARGLEGVMAKKADAPYRGGRGDSWLKIALKHVADFAIVGWADDWGALYLATWDNERFVYAGKVGSGFTPRLADSVRARLEPTRLRQAPCAGEPPREKEAVWCEPTMVCEVRYKNWPAGLALREPAFLRFRPDKTPQECPSPREGLAPEPGGSPPPPPTVALSNASKVFFPEDGLTKGDLFAYYLDVSRWLLPYLRDRPLMMTRYPDGITGKSFFQKAKPEKAPAFIRSVRVHNEEEQRDLEQIVCDDLQTLEWCVAMGAIPFHLPASRVAAPERADWAVIDLDPKDAPFAHVRRLAEGLRALCDAVELPSFPKLSGSTGMHVLVPLGGQLDHAGARQLAELLATLLVQRHPNIATLDRVVHRRAGKVYVDALQNGAGKVLAAPLCVRPHTGAPVAMTLRWEEVDEHLEPRSFTIRNALAHLERHGDPMAPVLSLRPPLEVVLAKLSELASAAPGSK